MHMYNKQKFVYEATILLISVIDHKDITDKFFPFFHYPFDISPAFS